jgi:hypothetical protein
MFGRLVSRLLPMGFHVVLFQYSPVLITLDSTSCAAAKLTAPTDHGEHYDVVAGHAEHATS